MTLPFPIKVTWKIIKCISFILVCAFLFSFISPFFLPKSNKPNSDIRNSLARGFYGEPKNSLDVIAVGNSNMECGFSPLELWKQYGITGYTCGEPAQTIFEGYNVLSEVLTCQKPKVVILGAEGIFPYTGGRMEIFNSFLNSNLYRIFPIIQYHNLWKTIDSGNITKTVSYNWISPTKGYMISNKTKPLSNLSPITYDSSWSRVSAATMIQLDMFKKICRNNGIHLLLVYLPTAISWDQRRHDFMEKYAAENDLPFIELNNNKSLNLKWESDSMDGGIHLNFSGAKKVTLFIGDYLHKHYSLPDHRKDKAYAQWNQYYNDYKVLTKTAK